MKHRPSLPSNSPGGSPAPLGWADVTAFAISAALVTGVTISTGSAGEATLALGAVVTAVRVLTGRQGVGGPS